MLRDSLAVTLLVLLAGGAFLIVYDVILVQTQGVGATISWRTLQFSRENPIAPAIFGAVVGVLSAHLFTDRTRGLLCLHQPFVALSLGVLCGLALGGLFWVQKGPQ